MLSWSCRRCACRFDVCDGSRLAAAFLEHLAALEGAPLATGTGSAAPAPAAAAANGAAPAAKAAKHAAGQDVAASAAEPGERAAGRADVAAVHQPPHGGPAQSGVRAQAAGGAAVAPCEAWLPAEAVKARGASGAARAADPAPSPGSDAAIAGGLAGRDAKGAASGLLGGSTSSDSVSTTTCFDALALSTSADQQVS